MRPTSLANCALSALVTSDSAISVRVALGDHRPPRRRVRLGRHEGYSVGQGRDLRSRPLCSARAPRRDSRGGDVRHDAARFDAAAVD
jgi:hypothetical protein